MNVSEHSPQLPSSLEQREKSKRDLNWHSVLARIAEHAINEPTVERLTATEPFEAREDAERMHTWVREAMTLHTLGARLPIRRINPLDSVLPTLQRGAVASGVELRDVTLCLEQAFALRGHVSSHEAHAPNLRRELDVAPSLTELAQRLRAALNEHGELYDGASEALRAARRELANSRDALRAEQAQLLRKYKDHLAGAFFAEREGRLVLPFRTDAGRVEGTVLGSSGSGNTLYVEPSELTAPNNRARIAEARVHQEETRVLAELSALLSPRVEEIRSAYEVTLLADRIAACATWAVRHDAHPIELAEQPVLRLVQMRHPLLLSSRNDRSAPFEENEVIASDLELLLGQALILSGPNAGGKTVALKCLGLAALLARSGLPVPCSPESEIGWFSEVVTDVGDDQSISRSLSTFSAHITNLAACLTASHPGTLLLLDEIAGGTDPEEGAALAVALLQAFTQAGASVATTTHYERLKQLGAADDGTFRNASVGFDLQQMKPTFRVTLGVPGASSALAVAERYGIPSHVVAAARAKLPTSSHDQQRLIQQLESELARATAARESAEALLAEIERRKEALEREREHALRNDRQALERLAAELTREVQTARADLRRAKALLGTGTKDAYREAEALVSSAAQPITVDGSLTRATAPSTARQERAPEAQVLSPGTLVRLLNLNTDAVIVEAPTKGQVRVSVNGLKMSVPLAQVQLAKVGAKPPQRRGKTSSRNPARDHDASSSQGEALRTQHNTCDLRGVRVDDGLVLVDRFLDEMLRMREPAAFILHGHGTGAMKSAVRSHLATSRVVRHFEPAPQDNGGDAFTIAWLR